MSVTSVINSAALAGDDVFDDAPVSFRDDCLMMFKASQEAERERAGIKRREENAINRANLQLLARRQLDINVPALSDPLERGERFACEPGIILVLREGAFLAGESHADYHPCALSGVVDPAIATPEPSEDETFLAALRTWVGANVDER